jgi:hypothetical protein
MRRWRRDFRRPRLRLDRRDSRKTLEDETKEHVAWRVGCIGPSLAEEALACNSQSEVAPGLGVKPSVNLIETALQRETVAAEYSVSCQSRHERLPLCAVVFTKGCVGVQPQGKERLDNLEKKDRDIQTSAANL